MPSPANGKSFEIDRNAAQVCSRPLAKLSVVNRIDTPLQQCGFILPCSWQREAIAWVWRLFSPLSDQKRFSWNTLFWMYWIQCLSQCAHSTLWLSTFLFYHLSIFTQMTGTRHWIRLKAFLVVLQLSEFRSIETYKLLLFIFKPPWRIRVKSPSNLNQSTFAVNVFDDGMQSYRSVSFTVCSSCVSCVFNADRLWISWQLLKLRYSKTWSGANLLLGNVVNNRRYWEWSQRSFESEQQKRRRV